MKTKHLVGLGVALALGVGVGSVLWAALSVLRLRYAWDDSSRRGAVENEPKLVSWIHRRADGAMFIFGVEDYAERVPDRLFPATLSRLDRDGRLDAAFGKRFADGLRSPAAGPDLHEHMTHARSERRRVLGAYVGEDRLLLVAKGQVDGMVYHDGNIASTDARDHYVRPLLLLPDRADLPVQADMPNTILWQYGTQKDRLAAFRLGADAVHPLGQGTCAKDCLVAVPFASGLLVAQGPVTLGDNREDAIANSLIWTGAAAVQAHPFRLSIPAFAAKELVYGIRVAHLMVIDQRPTVVLFDRSGTVIVGRCDEGGAMNDAIVFKTSDAWAGQWATLSDAFNEPQRPINWSLISRPVMLKDGLLGLALGVEMLALVRLGSSGVIDVDPQLAFDQPKAYPQATVIRLQAGIEALGHDGVSIGRHDSKRYLYDTATNTQRPARGPDWLGDAPCCVR